MPSMARKKSPILAPSRQPSMILHRVSLAGAPAAQHYGAQTGLELVAESGAPANAALHVAPELPCPSVVGGVGGGISVDALDATGDQDAHLELIEGVFCGAGERRGPLH